MNPLKITSTQSTAVTPADSSSAASDSGSDFGPILKAASVAPAQAESRHDAGAKAVADPNSSPKADRTGRRSGRDAVTSAQPQADATAAASAAAAASIPLSRTDSIPSRTSPATDSATRDAHGDALDASSAGGDPTAAGSPIAKARAVVLSDATPPALAPLTGAEAPVLRPLANANSPTPVDPHRVVTAQPPGIDASAKPLERASASQAGAAAPVQSSDAQSADDNSDDGGGADVQADSGFATLAPASSLPAGSAAQAAAHALSTQVQQAVPPAATGTTPHAANVAASVPSDPTGNLTSAAAGSGTSAFGSVTAYPAEGRTAVATPVGQPGFGQEFSERVMVLARGGVQTAQISLEPAGLGPVGVSIQVHGHAASLVFTAQHETTRNALEAELPRLREMFAASGMQLSDASVGGRTQPDWSAPNDAPSSGQAPASDGADAVTTGSAGPGAGARPLGVPRLVDTYA